MNLPTWITISRLLGLPFIFYLLSYPTPINRWLCTVIFVIAASTDWLDGYLARKLDLVTELGKFLNPLVDKLLVLGSMLALIELQKIPAWGVCLILARELAIAGWRVNPKLTGNSSISGANIWGKLKTVSQIIANRPVNCTFSRAMVFAQSNCFLVICLIDLYFWGDLFISPASRSLKVTIDRILNYCF